MSGPTSGGVYSGLVGPDTGTGDLRLEILPDRNPTCARSRMMYGDPTYVCKSLLVHALTSLLRPLHIDRKEREVYQDCSDTSGTSATLSDSSRRPGHSPFSTGTRQTDGGWVDQ